MSTASRPVSYRAERGRRFVAVRYHIKAEEILSRLEADGPLAQFLEPFSQRLSQTGYVRLYIMRHVLLAARFSKWLKQIAVPRDCMRLGI